jgi:arylsulfatase A
MAMELFTTFANIAGAEIPANRVINAKNILPLMQAEEGAKSPRKAIYGFRLTEN